MVALTSPQIALWQSNYNAYYWAYCHAPTTIFAARVNMPTATYPTSVITFDTVTTGAYTDLTPELLLLIGSAAGLSDYGRQRIHANSSGVVATATTINIGRSSQGVNDGSLNLVDNAYITVLDLRPIWAAPPFIDEPSNPDSPTTYKDGIIPFNATYAFSPVLNMGVDSLKIVATSGDSTTFDFDASTSFKTHPSATSSLTYAWVFPGGTPSTATGATVTGVSFPVGARYVKCTVTDSLGNTQVGWRLKAVSYVGDPNLIPKFTITRHRFPTDGQEFQIQVDSPLPFSTYPDGTEVLVAERERYGTTVGSLTGYPDAQSMILAGWLQSEDNSGVADKKGFIGRTTLTIVDAAGRLKVLPGFPQVVVRKSSPTKWEEMAGSNIDRYLYYLIAHHSNALTRVDFAWSGTLDTYGFSTLGSDGQSLYEQMDKRCQAIAYRLTCNKNGQLAMKPDPLLQPTAAQQSQYSLPTTRTTTVVVPITEADWLNYSYSYTRHPRIHWNWGNAIIVTTVDADTLADIPTAFCVAPGLAPGQGVGQQTSGEQLAVNQAELNVREGNRYAARMNAVTGFFTVQIRPGDVVDPADMVWVQFSITSTTAGPRGRTYLSERFLPVEVNYSYTPQKGLRTCKLTLEREVSGTPAVLDPQPQPGQSQLPPGLPPFSPQPSIPLPSPSLGRSVQRMALICVNGVMLTSDFQTMAALGGPTYTMPYSAPWGGTLLQWVPNGFAPGSGWIVTTTEVGYLTLSSGSYSVKYTFGTASIYRSADASFIESGFFSCLSFYDGVGVKSLSTTNNFSTIVGSGEVMVSAHWNTDAGGVAPRPGCYVSQKTTGLIYTTAFTSTAASGHNSPPASAYHSSDHGATWATSSSPIMSAAAVRLAQHISVPYAANDSIAFYAETSENVAGSGNAKLYRSNGGSALDVSPLISGVSFTLTYSRDVMATSVTDANRALVAAQSSASSTFAVFLSYNAQASPPSWTIVDGSGSSYRRCTIAGDDTNTGWVWGVSNAIAQVGMSGTITLDSRTGNLASLSPGEIISIGGF